MGWRLALNSSVSIPIINPQNAEETSNKDTPDAVTKNVTMAASRYCGSCTELNRLAPMVPSSARPASVAINAAGNAANKLTTTVAPSPAIILNTPADTPAI